MDCMDSLALLQSMQSPLLALLKLDCAETESIKLAPVDCRHLALFGLEPLPLIEVLQGKKPELRRTY